MSPTPLCSNTHETYFSRHMRHRPWVLLLLAAPLVCLASSPATPAPASQTTSHHMTCMGERPSIEGDHATRPDLSRRALSTEPAHIEAVLSKYADLSPKPANLAQGVAHWDPPPAALRQMETGLTISSNHKYGPALGESSLRDALVKKLQTENGLDMSGQEVHVTRHVENHCGLVCCSWCVCSCVWFLVVGYSSLRLQTYSFYFVSLVDVAAVVCR